MVLCEVQQYSDLTYRVYDYGRLDARGKPRELHIEKALDVMSFSNTAGVKVPPLPLYSGSHGRWGKRTLLSACPYFAAERWEFYGSMGANTSLRRGSAFNILVVLDGKGQIGWSKGGEVSWDERHKASNWGRVEFSAGECWFVPACLDVHPGTAAHAAMLCAYVPNLARLCSELKVERHSSAAIARTVFD